MIINNMKKNLFKTICATLVVASFLFLAFGSGDSKTSENNSSSNNTSNDAPSSSSESATIDNTNTCNICGKEFTGKGYEEVSEGVWQPCKDPNQCFICSRNCGLQSTRNMDKILEKYGVNPSTIHDNNSYHEGDEGKIYESNACPLCNGTGIEKNKSQLSDEYGRICPMCDGKGVRSY